MRKLIRNKKAIGLRGFFLGFIMIAVFSFLILSFAYNYINATNPSSPVLTQYNTLNNSIQQSSSIINGFTTIADQIYTQQLAGAHPNPLQYVFLMFEGAFFIPLAMASFIWNFFPMLTGLLFPNLTGGASTIVSMGLAVLTASVTITIVLLVVKAIRTGETER